MFTLLGLVAIISVPWIDLGNRVVTAYNPIVEQTDSRPCEGALPEINLCTTTLDIVATNELPLRSIVQINGKEYLVADRTNSKYHYRYDILMRDKQDAINFGKKILMIKVNEITK